MKFKKITAAIAAAAMLAAAAPMTGVLPNTLGVTASAATPDLVQTEYKVGDVFYAGIGSDGNIFGVFSSADREQAGNDVLKCTVKADGTISVGYDWEIFSYNLYNCTLTIPSKIGGYTVTELTKSFALSGAKKVVIPETVQTIAHETFANDYFLEEVEFSGNSQLKLIDQWAFQDCRSLKSITIPASVETIAYGAFMNSDQECVASTINSPIGEVYNYQNVYFTDTYSLTDVKFAEGSKLKTIGEYAFERQLALKSIVLPDSLEKIGDRAFRTCMALTKINVPKNVDEIGAYAFLTRGLNHECGSMSEITVDENNPNFKSVNGVVFSKDGKTLIVYPVAKSGKYDIPADVNKIAEGAFLDCQKLTSVTIPEGITDIPENAFSYCTTLAEVKLPSTLKTIGKWGFEATALTSIDIPESVTAIDALAFESSSLKNINGTAASYAETFAKENGYTFKVTEKPDDTSKPTDTSDTFKDDSADKAADIEVIAKPNVIPKEAHFSVRLDDANTTAERIAYNCYFTYNGAEYEPTDTVTVKIPVPVAMRDIANTLKVYHLQDGKYVNMKAKVENGYLVFDTDHFSTYVVTAENLDNESDSDTVTPGDTDATSDGGNSGNDQSNTGIALAMAPVLLAASAAVVVLSKKKK